MENQDPIVLLGNWTLTKQMLGFPRMVEVTENTCGKCALVWLQKLLMVFRKTYLQVHLAGGAASLTLAGKLCRTSKSIFSCLRFSCSPWYSQGLRPKHGNNATNVSEGLACCLYPSGQPWEWMTALSMLVGHQGIPFHTTNLWLHFGYTCIFHLYQCSTVNTVSIVTISPFCFPPYYLMSFLGHLLRHSPPNTCRHASTSNQLQDCDPWDELGRQKHKGKVYGQSVCFPW